MNVESAILSHQTANRKMLAVLLDPENLAGDALIATARLIGESQPDFVFVGGSTFYSSTGDFIRTLRPHIGNIPVVLFPGHPSQFSPEADAVLFLSLISGTNPDTLIGQQIASARAIREAGTESISMGYMLVDGGKESTTLRVTGTTALPADDIRRIVDTAIAGEMLGLHTIYLEAGSGADSPASETMIAAVRQHISCPLIVGGGIRKADQLRAAWHAGADIAVVGNWLESHPEDLPALCLARDEYNKKDL